MIKGGGLWIGGQSVKKEITEGKENNDRGSHPAKRFDLLFHI